MVACKDSRVRHWRNVILSCPYTLLAGRTAREKLVAPKLPTMVLVAI